MGLGAAVGGNSWFLFLDAPCGWRFGTLGLIRWGSLFLCHGCGRILAFSAGVRSGVGCRTGFLLVHLRNLSILMSVVLGFPRVFVM